MFVWVLFNYVLVLDVQFKAEYIYLKYELFCNHMAK